MKHFWVIAGMSGLAACSQGPAEPVRDAEVGTRVAEEAYADARDETAGSSEAAAAATITPASCTIEETPIFSCTVEGGKRLSVCGSSGGAVQYRFGDEDKAELVLDGGVWASVPYSGGGEAQIKFENVETSYIVFSQIIRTNIELGEPNNPAISDGVVVVKDGEKIAKRLCDDDDVKPVDYDAAKAFLPMEKELFAEVAP